MNYFVDFDVNKAVSLLAKAGACVVSPFLTETTHQILLNEVSTLRFEPQPEVKGPHNVKQNFSLAIGAESNKLLVNLQGYVERMLNHCLTAYRPWPISEIIQFNELRIQKYEPCEIGISLHRDGKSFINIIVIIILEGEGEFCIADDREGTNTQVLVTVPGDMILMVAPGFNGADYQPFHYVRNVRTTRITMSLRHNKALDQ